MPDNECPFSRMIYEDLLVSNAGDLKCMAQDSREVSEGNYRHVDCSSSCYQTCSIYLDVMKRNQELLKKGVS
ncbi:MAG: hypothetical protein WCK90_02235 [archaeon]